MSTMLHGMQSASWHRFQVVCLCVIGEHRRQHGPVFQLPVVGGAVEHLQASRAFSIAGTR